MFDVWVQRVLELFKKVLLKRNKPYWSKTKIDFKMDSKIATHKKWKFHPNGTGWWFKNKQKSFQLINQKSVVDFFLILYYTRFIGSTILDYKRPLTKMTKFLEAETKSLRKQVQFSFWDWTILKEKTQNCVMWSRLNKGAMFGGA